ncbi:hypothetical protein L915_19596 [Phytophthora nicotianae]|nr:hypothetical protein L915_19596 [Phytophthora nicotianae]
MKCNAKGIKTEERAIPSGLMRYGAYEVVNQPPQMLNY